MTNIRHGTSAAFFALAGVASIALSTPARALPLPALPDATYDLFIPGVGNQTTPGSLTFAYNGEASYSLAATANPSVPQVNIASTWYYTGSSPQAEDGLAQASMEYFYEISGPANELVPITVSYTASFAGTLFNPFGAGDNTTGYSIGFDASASVQVQSYGVGPGNTIISGSTVRGGVPCDIFTSSGNACASSETSTTFGDSDTLTLFAMSDTPYQIILDAEVSNGSYGIVDALADPFVQIDPSFADAPDFSVVTSDGVGNEAPTDAPVPEPTSLSLLITGLLVTINLWRRRRPS